MTRHKTLRGVCMKDGVPVVERLPNGDFDILCHGNDGSCRGCVYHKANALKPCLAQCRDGDGIFWIHAGYVGNWTDTRVKRAKLYDTLVAPDGEEFIILDDASRPMGFDVCPRDIRANYTRKGESNR